MTDHHQVQLRKAGHVFCAGHFITLSDDVCEPVHGHNWTVGVDLEGSPDPHGMVIDFIALRDALKSVTEQLDHFMLLPTEHPTIKVRADEREVLVTFEDRRWIFPRCDCVLLPLANTTAELLARWIGQRLLEELSRRLGVSPSRLQIAVDEDNGQWGQCELVNA